MHTGAVCQQWSVSSLYPWCCDVLVPLSTSLQAWIHNHHFLHLIHGSIFNSAASYVVFQQSPRNTGCHRVWWTIVISYVRFNCIHVFTTWVVQTLSKTPRAVPLQNLGYHWVWFSRSCHRESCRTSGTISADASWNHKGKVEVSPTGNVTQVLSAFDADKDDGLDLWNIPPSGAFELIISEEKIFRAFESIYPGLSGPWGTFKWDKRQFFLG